MVPPVTQSPLTADDFERIAAKHDGLEAHDAEDYLRTALPNDADIQAFMDWDWKRYQARTQAYTAPEIPPAQSFIETINNTNFNNTGHIARLAEMLDLPAAPYIGLGTFQGLGYRLLPDPHILASDKFPDFSGKDQSQLLPELFLGVNTNVDHPIEKTNQTRSREDKSPEKSTTSVPTDSDENGFVFFQLGGLEMYLGDWLTANEQDMSDPVRWANTGFAVVLKISQYGIPGDIYIMFNFNPLDEVTGDRKGYEEHTWGFLDGNGRQQTAFAKIASSITSLKHDRPFVLDLVHDTVPEYVCAIRQADGLIVRQSVFEET